MRRLIQAKLKSKRGISVLMALGFMMISLSAGAVILSAAAGNAGRTRSNWTEQQKYLAVSSAANMLRDDICAMQFNGKYTRIDTTVEPEPEVLPESPTYKDDECKLVGSKLFTKDLLDFGPAFHYQYASPEDRNKNGWKQPTSDTVLKMTIDGDPATEVANLPTVTAEIKAINIGAKAFYIQATVYLEEVVGEESIQHYKMTMEFKPEINPNEVIKSDSEIEGFTTTTTKTYTRSVTVKWLSPKVERGVA